MPPPGPVLTFPIKANRDQDQYQFMVPLTARFALHKAKAIKNEENYCRVGLNHMYKHLFRQFDPTISLAPSKNHGHLVVFYHSKQSNREEKQALSNLGVDKLGMKTSLAVGWL